MKRHFKNEPTQEQLDELVKFVDRFEHHGLFLDPYRFFSFDEMPKDVAEAEVKIAPAETLAGTSSDADVASKNTSAGDDAVARSKDVREKLRGLFGKSPEELHQIAQLLAADGEGVDDVLDGAEKSANKKTPAGQAGKGDDTHAGDEDVTTDGDEKIDVDLADQNDASPQLPPNWIEVPLYDENALHDLYRPLAQKAGSKEAPEHLVQRLASYLTRGNKRRLVGLPPDWAERLDTLTDRFLNFKTVIEYVRTECQVASLSASTAVKLPPILLGGPPGIGKTAFALELATILNGGFYMVPMENAQSGAAICGSAKFWSNTRTGLVFDVLMDHEFINPVFLIDELDKASGSDRFDPIAPLYQLLERRTAAMFRDESIPELAIDTSYINWILTANDMDRIPAPIRSRLHIFEVPPPTYDQTKQILQRLFIETVTELKANVVAPDYVVLLDQMTLAPVVEDALSLHGIRVVKRLIRSATVKALGRRSSVVEFPDIYDLTSFEVDPIYMLPQ